MYGGDQWGRVTIPELSGCLDELAKSRIRHIRAVRGESWSELRLAQFPRLETCEFLGRPLIAGDALESISLADADDQTWIEYAACNQFKYLDPQLPPTFRCETDAQTSKVKILMTFPIYIINYGDNNRPFPRVSRMKPSVPSMMLNRY